MFFLALLNVYEGLGCCFHVSYYVVNGSSAKPPTFRGAVRENSRALSVAMSRYTLVHGSSFFKGKTYGLPNCNEQEEFPVQQGLLPFTF